MLMGYQSQPKAHDGDTPRPADRFWHEKPVEHIMEGDPWATADKK